MARPVDRMNPPERSFPGVTIFGVPRPSIGDQPRKSGRRGRLTLGKARSSRASSTPSGSTWIARWGVVVAACVTAVGAITVGIINSSSNTQGKPSGSDAEVLTSTPPLRPTEETGSTQPQESCHVGNLSVTSVTLRKGDQGRVVHVEGQWDGPRLAENETVYAIARPVGSEQVTDIAEPTATSSSGTLNWYVSAASGFDQNGAWKALIEISAAEKRDLVIQAICARYCPEDQGCDVPVSFLPMDLDPEEPRIRTRS